jgi:hypothetical protein
VVCEERRALVRLGQGPCANGFNELVDEMQRAQARIGREDARGEPVEGGRFVAELRLGAGQEFLLEQGALDKGFNSAHSLLRAFQN